MYPRKNHKSLSPESAVSLNSKHQEPYNIQKLDDAIHLALVAQKMDSVIRQGPVVQKVDNAIRHINHYPVDNAIGFCNTCALDSDLSGRSCSKGG